MSNLSARISALSPEQRALLEKQLQAARRDSLALQTITRRREADFYPLSLEQEHLWFLDQMEPGSSAYNISSSFQLSGVLDFDSLERSFGELVRRHESLRTSFPAADGRPRQVVAPPLTFRLPVVDLADVPKAAQSDGFERLVNERAREPFDLSRGPLIRACLFRLNETEHRLLLTLHHIITDKWSFALLWRELTTLYDAFSKGLPSPLPELPIQFADYALWQRRWLEGEVLESSWRTGRGNWPARRSSSTCPPTGRVPRARPSAARGCTGLDPAPSGRSSRRSASRRARPPS